MTDASVCPDRIIPFQNTHIHKLESVNLLHTANGLANLQYRCTFSDLCSHLLLSSVCTN